MANRRLHILGLIGVVAAAVAVCLTVPGPGPRPKKLDLKPADAPKAAPKGTMSPHGAPLPFKLKDGKAILGNPSAKVKVTVFIPATEGCGNQSATFLYAVAKTNPGKLYLTVLDFHADVGQKTQSATRTSCAGMMINGKQQLTLTDASGRQRKLNFHSNLGDTYTERDVYLALDQAFRQAYGAKCKRAPTETTSMPRAPGGGSAADQKAKLGAKAG